MKIGVLTWFRDANYGTILQAFSLQEYLRQNGHAPCLINYIPPRNATLPIRATFFERLLRKYNYLSECRYIKKNKDGFERKRRAAYKLIDEHCVVTSEIRTDEDFLRLNKELDAFICGSDQVWNPFWLDGKFFLDFVQNDKLKIAYAPSVGISALPYELGEKIGKYLDNFDYVSVREYKAVQMLRPYTNREISVVCDPIFLLKKEEWRQLSGNFCSSRAPYIFFYLLSFQPEHWGAIVKFAKRKKLKLVGIPVYGATYYVKDCEKFPFASPEEFVSLIDHAEYVVTDSFHATAFSILLEKQFYTFERFKNDNIYSQNSRVDNLLHLLRLEDRRQSFGAKNIQEADEINYERVQRIMQEYVDFSKKYLQTALKKS